MLASLRSVDDIAGDIVLGLPGKGVGPRAAVERGDLTAGRSLRQIAGRATGAARLEGLLMGGSLSCGRSVGRIISGAAPAVTGIRAARTGLAPYQRIAALVAAL